MPRAIAPIAMQGDEQHGTATVAAADPRYEMLRDRAGFFAIEMTISLILNIGLAGLATLLLSDWQRGSNGEFQQALTEMTKSTIGPLTGFVIPLTLAIRRRMRRGTITAMTGSPFLPRNLLLRLLVFCAITPIALGLPAACLLHTLAPQGSAFLLFKLGYGAVIALIITPFVLVAALRDR